MASALLDASDRGFYGYSSVCSGEGQAVVFVFFSNRLGCGGSILVSLIGTVFVLLLFGVIDLR